MRIIGPQRLCITLRH